MHVIATAGHVDHGKSTLVRALTGMEPDRWAEERRRGMTIDLGYAWTALPSGQTVAFVDVPGHERFTTNMLAGVGPVPAVLFVVAADGGWAAQAEEHLAALAALGVSRAVLAVTRADLADPGPALAAAGARLAEAGLPPTASLAVSGLTGAGLSELRGALDELAGALPAPDTTGPVRLWIDRAFTIRGAGTVVTGTLGSGRIEIGGELALGPDLVSVRGLQQLGEPVTAATAVARVAVNLRGVALEQVHRGDALTTPNGWVPTRTADLRVTALTDRELPRQLVFHLGSAALPAAVRVLGADIVRLRWSTPVPLHPGDRGLLRDPGQRRVLAGAVVLDPLPPPLRRRGAAAARAGRLHAEPGPPDAEREVARRGAVRTETLLAMGLAPPPAGAASVVTAAGWLVHAGQWAAWQAELRAAVATPREGELLAAGVPRAQLAARLPDPALLDPLVAGCPEVESAGAKVRPRGHTATLPAPVAAAVEQLRARLTAEPFAAPEHRDLQALGLGPRELGAAAAAGAVLRLPGDVVLLPDAPRQAATRLAGLPAPFTLSAARQALATTRRVAVPLLEHLDRCGVTVRVSGTERRLR